tara:strand:+ start:434 stop:901 length:468 start_codon:yes stop_codon:yes gene_type:complete
MKHSKFMKELHKAIIATIKQGKRSGSDIPDIYASKNETKFVCQYTSSEDSSLHCAIGHIMTKPELKAYGNYEGNVSALLKQGWRKSVYTSEQYNKLVDLQISHDGCKRNSSTSFEPNEFRFAFIDNLLYEKVITTRSAKYYRMYAENVNKSEYFS